MLPASGIESSLAAAVMWWLLLLVCAGLALPLSRRLFPGNADGGFLPAKCLGPLIATYAAWLVSSLGLLSFAAWGPIVGLAALCILCLAMFRKLPMSQWKDVLRSEIVFLVFFIVGLWIRSVEPDIFGLEKFMDFGFMNAARMTDSMPPPDPWYGGAPINYYYFGHVTAAWLSQTSGVTADVGYNLMMATLFAWTGSLAYGLIRDCLHSYGIRVAEVLACIGSVATVLGGNFHTVVFGVFRKMVSSQTGRDYYFFPDSTRFVGFDPPTDDKAFSEMPGYGFAVGDMHGHLLNLPTNLLLLSVLFAAVAANGGNGRSATSLNPRHMIVIGWLFGLSIMTNTWDIGIYGLAVMLIGVFSWLATGPIRFKDFCIQFIQGLGILVIALFVAMPFLRLFEPFNSGLRWSENTTPIWQWLTLYMNFLPGCLLAIGLLIFRKDKTATTVFAAALGSTAISMLLVPELVYLKDIYGADHARANTMFKLSFQAQPMGILASIMAVGLAMASSRTMVFVLGAVATALTASPLVYPYYWLWDRIKTKPLSAYTLQGIGFLDRDAPEDAHLLHVVRRLDLRPGEIILEASGDSYSLAGRFSALTGRPTALGWPVHEWLWRGSWDKISARSKLVSDIYSGQNIKQICVAVDELKVRYVIVGAWEAKQFPNFSKTLLLQVSDVKARVGKSTIFGIKKGACASQ